MQTPAVVWYAHGAAKMHADDDIVSHLRVKQRQQQQHATLELHIGCAGVQANCSSYSLRSYFVGCASFPVSRANHCLRLLSWRCL